MEYIAPKVSTAGYRRTKIIATVGPATNSYEMIYKLIKAGANGIRLNFSHGTYDERDEQIKWIRQAAKELGKPVAIIQDLQGPKIRLGDFEGVVTVQNGQNLLFRYQADYQRENILPVQYDLSQKVKRGEHMLLFDGKVQTVVTSVKDGIIYARAQNSGILIARKGINLPDTDFEGDIITTKDKADMAFGVDKGVDYIALSFVQSADDIKTIKRLLHNLGSDIKVIAKIETKAALENLEEIIQEADATMVARGDLAIEAGLEKVPIVQRKIIGLGLKYGRPSIVATQMLASMVESPTPTRAEASDVATAVLLGTDAMMLSDETAAGTYPIQTVKTMRNIIKYVEKNAPSKEVYSDFALTNPTSQEAMSKAVMELADSLKASAIVAETKSGATALKIASWRSPRTLIAVTSSPKVAQQLAILYGCMSFVRPDGHDQTAHLTEWLKQHKILQSGSIIVTVSGQHPGVVGTTDTIKVRHIE